jgi:hypothetical protein
VEKYLPNENLTVHEIGVGQCRNRLLSFISSRKFNNPEIVLVPVLERRVIPTSLQTPAGNPGQHKFPKKNRKKRKARTSILYHKPTLDIPFGNISTSAWITSPATHIYKLPSQKHKTGFEDHTTPHVILQLRPFDFI